MHKIRILFLCAGNSCRLQMTEGWSNHLGHDIAEFESAGVDISGLESTRVTGVMTTAASAPKIPPDCITDR